VIGTHLIISQIILMIFAAWLLCVAYFALSAPNKAKASMANFGSTPLLHYGEHILRMVVGFAFMGAAEVTHYPRAFNIIGVFLIGSSLLIMILPRRWHHKYAVFWSSKMPIPAIRIAGIFTILAAILLVRLLPIAVLPV